MLGRAPRARLVAGLRADAEECVEGAGRRLTREDLAGIFADSAIEEIAPRAQLGAELLDAFLRPFERAYASVLHDRRNVARGVEERFLRPIADCCVANRALPDSQPRQRL